jgi:predicted transglutaminase-like cysteine proteinase
MPTHDFKDVGDVLGYDLIRSNIVSLNSDDDTCTVTVKGSIVPAILFYHCQPDSIARSNGAIEGAATGFSVGDDVIVMVKNDRSVVKVIAHTDGIRKCGEKKIGGDYYIFYLDGSIMKIANCTYDNSGISIKDTFSYLDVDTGNVTVPIRFLCKKFTYNALTNGEIVSRDFYFIMTNIYIYPETYQGWTNFQFDNPSWPLVTNKLNTDITMSSQLLTDLNSVNYTVNHAHTYSGESGDVWNIMTEGESGDCEDFALTKAQALLDLGYPASALHIECALVKGTISGHAWLVVQTTGGDYALDTSSDTIIINSSLKTPDGAEYICRKRQIGNQWAFISPFSWMFYSSIVNTYGGVLYNFCYVLDPLLNILHYVGYEEGIGFCYGFSYNSSLDGNSVYFHFSNGSLNQTYIYQGKIEENQFTWINSTTQTWTLGYVGRDGNLIPFDDAHYYAWEIISRPGYFECIYPDGLSPENHQYVCEPAPIISINVDTPTYEETSGSTGVFHTPFTETFSYTGLSDFKFPWWWTHIEEGVNNLRSFFFITGPEARYYGLTNFPRSFYSYPRIYRNSEKVINDIIAAIGTTEINLLGLAYIPSTDRLN